MRPPVVITGGGTGGHIFPMQAIAEALIAQGASPTELLFVGSRRGKERELLGQEATPLVLLPGRGIRRSLSPRALLQNCGAILGLVSAQVRAVLLVGRLRPAAVVSVGGYASFAVSVAAVIWRRPLVLVEFDATQGAAHRVVSRFATRRCVAFSSDDSRDVVTGAPLRATISTIDRSGARVNGASRTRWTVVVMTGSLGASSVNRAVVALADVLRDRDDVTLLHVTGDRDFDWVRKSRDVRPTDRLDYRVEAFGDMTTLWSTCDVAICRAGAMTVAELTYLGIPSVLVPLPNAPGDHQTKNARVLEDAGAAVVINDSEVSGAVLARVIDDLFARPDRMQDMARASLALGHADAAAAIADVVREVSEW